MSGEYTELVDVALIPHVRCPMALEPDSPQMKDAITFEDECGEARAEYEGSASSSACGKYNQPSIAHDLNRAEAARHE